MSYSTSKYRRTIYRCNNKFNGEEKCETPHLDEETIKQLFASAVNKLLADKDEIIANFALIKDDLFGTTDFEAERAELQEETAVVAELIQKCIEENARTALDQKEYQEHYEGLVARFDTAKARFEEVSELVSDKKARRKLVQSFISELVRQDGLIAEFDERLWFSLVDFATVYSENDVRFMFKKAIINRFSRFIYPMTQRIRLSAQTLCKTLHSIIHRRFISIRFQDVPVLRRLYTI